METTKKRIIQNLITTLTIFVIVMTEFSLIGSYAIDAIKTNNGNVKFVAYFENESGEEVTEITSEMDKENIKLKMKVSVGNEKGLGGYFNGQISLNNANFKFIDGETINDVVVNANDSVVIEKEIELLDINELETSYLSQSSTVVLSGKYVNSKSENDISGKSEVKVNWLSSESIKASLSSKVLTNKEYSIDGETKRLAQILVASSLREETYPIKETKIEMNIPEGAEKVTVHKRDTNKSEYFGEENYLYNSETGILTITIKNEEKDGKINWVKNGKDILVVTCQYPEDIELVEEVNISSKVTIYDGKELEETATVKIEEETDGVVSAGIRESEKSIYKGKIYTGENREYVTTTAVNIDSSKIVDEIEIEEGKTEFKAEDAKREANIEYTETKISKDQIVKIFGEEGTIIIKDQDGNTIQYVTRESEIDENGYVVIQYGEGVTSITVTTSKPQTEGTLVLEHTKTIKQSGYTRKQIEELIGIEESATLIYKNNDNSETLEKVTSIIELKETESKVTLDLNTISLSTVETNKNVEVIVKLDEKDESKNLYKDPVVDIVFPEEVTKVSVSSDLKANAIYKNGLKVKNCSLYNTSDKKCAIHLELEGEQTAYDTNEGTEIHLYVDIDTDNLTPSKNAEIEMEYTNKNDNSKNSTNKEVSLESQYGLMVYNELSNYNEDGEKTTSYNSDKTYAKLDVNGKNKISILETALVNNYDTEITNVVLVGSIPTESEDNTFTTTINKIVTDKEAKVYYSKEVNAKKDAESWTEDSTDAKSYKVEIEKIEKQEVAKLRVELQVPGDLDNNEHGSLTTSVTYIQNSKEQTRNSTMVLVTEASLVAASGAEGTSYELENGIEANVVAIGENKELSEGDNIYEGETIKYIVTIKNTSENDYTNLNVKATQKNGLIWNLVNREGINHYYDDEITHEDFYELTGSNEIELEKIETLEAGKSIILEYEATINKLKDCEGTETYSEISISEEGGDEVGKITTVKNNIQDAEIQLIFQEYDSRQKDWESESKVLSRLYVYNLTDNVMNDVELKVILSSTLDFKENNVSEVFPNTLEGDLLVKNIEKTADGQTIVTINIPKIEANNETILMFLPKTNKIEGEFDRVNLIATAMNDAGKAYYSNNLNRKIKQNIYSKIDIDIKQEAYLDGKTLIDDSTVVKDQEFVEFKTTITNKGVDVNSSTITENIPFGLEISEVKFTANGVEKDITSEFSEGLTVNIEEFAENENLTLSVKAKVNTSIANSNKLINKVSFQNIPSFKEYSSEKEITINKVVKSSTSNGNDENNENGGNNNNLKYTVSGMAWVDKNNDGKRDLNEQIINNMEIRVIDSSTGKIIDTKAQTLENGKYKLTLEKGKYIIVFMYDDSQYYVTTYQGSGIDETVNSDAITSTMTIDGQSRVVGATDVIDLNKDVANIDIGLVTREKFDVKLDKYVTKITVTNSNGTSTYDFNNSTSAKVEIPAKYLKGSLVVIEYGIKVTNIGEVPGYVRSIEDKKTNGLTFSSTLNSEWYENEGNLYNKSLSEIELKPGESKEVKVILTKTMTSSNTGLVNNTADINSLYNEKNLNDENKNNDIGKADIIIGVKTGEAFKVTGITIAIIAGIMAIAYIIVKKYVRKEV